MLIRLIQKLLLLSFILLIIAYFGFKISMPFVAGASKFKPITLDYESSNYTKELIHRAFQGINKPADYHTHLLGSDGTHGTYLNPDFFSWMNPVKHARFQIFMHASQVEQQKNSFEEYTKRLEDLINHMPKMTYNLFAFDSYYDDKGNPDLNKTDFYISNETVYNYAQKHPEYFKTVISIHPARTDAIKELKLWSDKGVKLVKWLPNAMNINPANTQYDEFYKTMVKLKMTLITHTGDEHAVSSGEQDFGNPLLFKQALDLGVNVIMAHTASIGQCSDIEHSNPSTQVSCFSLFMRLMNTDKYKKILYGDISSIYFFNREPQIVIDLLDNPNLHSRLINGSDYPLTAVNFMVHLRKLRKAELLSEKETVALKKIYKHNPILFDFVLKRTLKHPETGQKFSNEVFEEKTFYQ